MKYKKIVCLMAPLLMFGLIATGCGSVTVTSIQKTASYATEDTYTVTYSDGTSSSFTVKNGKDITVEDLYDKYKEVYGDELTYKEFLEKYLTVADMSTSVVGKALSSSLSVSMTRGSASQSGSAFLYATNEAHDSAYIVTNYHVVYVTSSSIWGGSSGGIATGMSCTLYGSSSGAISCTYVGGSASADVAVLKASLSALKAQNENVTPVSVATGYTVGETVYAVGNAEGMGISATKGIISVDSEEITLSVDGKNREHRAMRIDAAIYHGNSGGGLFNANGELVGITNGGEEDAQNINYAIPLSLATGIADNIIHHYETEDLQNAYKPLLGITVTTQNTKYVYEDALGKGHIEETLSVSGIYSVSSSATSNIAYTMGVRKNDVIKGLVINGTTYPVLRSYDINDILLKAYAGSTLQIVYERNGEKQTSSEYAIKSSDMKVVE